MKELTGMKALEMCLEQRLLMRDKGMGKVEAFEKVCPEPSFYDCPLCKYSSGCANCPIKILTGKTCTCDYFDYDPETAVSFTIALMYYWDKRYCHKGIFKENPELVKNL